MEQPPRIGRYELVERVGRGSMGVVYRGRDTLLEREVAVKVMSGEFSEEDGASERFLHEAKAAARLQHRNIVTIFEFGQYEGTPYIVMELLRGRPLSTRMQEAPPLSLTEKLDIVAQLCAGLDFAHEQGLVHRDVKPANVWLCDDGTVKLLDFGIAKAAASAVTSHGRIGTPSYFSPEQVAGAGNVDGRSDIFSVGILLYELLNGRKPFEADSPTAVMMQIANATAPPPQADEVPLSVAAVVDRALSKDPADRYQRAADLAGDLEAARMSDTIPPEETYLGTPAAAVQPAAAEPARPETQKEQLTRARNGRLVALAALMVVAIASVAGFMWWQRSIPPEAVVQQPEPQAENPAQAAVAAPAATEPPASSPSQPADTAGTGGDPTKPDENKAGEAKPEATAPATAQRTLVLESDPAGASIAVDGETLDNAATPFTLTFGDSEAPKRIRLAKAGYQPLEIDLTQQDLDAGSITRALAPSAPIPVVFTAPYEFEIFEGARRISPAAQKHELTVTGRRTFRLVAADVHLDRREIVDASRGKRLDVAAPPLAALTVHTSPALDGCSVQIGRWRLGPILPIDNRRIVAGTHVIELKCPDGQTVRRQISIKPGEQHREEITK